MPRRGAPRGPAAVLAGAALALALALLALAWAGAGAAAEGDCELAPGTPSVANLTPADGALGVARDAPVTANVNLPNCGGIDRDTLTSDTVRLVPSAGGPPVPATVNSSGGGDVIVLQPAALLAPFTSYSFQVTAGLKDLSGAAFAPFTSAFTTGASTGGTGGGTFAGAFEKVATTAPALEGGIGYTGLTIGPEGKLYAATNDGEIMRFTIAADGGLGPPERITALRDAHGPRVIIGMAFDPASTPQSPILWVTHNQFVFSDAPEWTGAISRLKGPGLATVEDVVVNLPRSVKDHLTNSLAFKDGLLHLTQGSNSSLGASDNAWGQRPERLLTGAVLRLDPSKLGTLPLDVKTPDGGGTYDPFAPGAPLTIYATGIRNAYDLVFHSNGHLYVPTNGAAGGGRTPATPASLPAACQRRIDAAARGPYLGPAVPEAKNVGERNDYLFRVEAGGYYGHPNAERCEWVLNGGNPTAGPDPAEVDAYPVGTLPDRNYRGSVFDFGPHYSTNGVVEYRSNAFAGALKGALMIVRYSAGDDIIVLTPDASGGIAASQTGIPGLTKFTNPLDLALDRNNGNLYVAEYPDPSLSTRPSRIVLARATVPGTFEPDPGPTDPGPTDPGPTDPGPTGPGPGAPPVAPGAPSPVCAPAPAPAAEPAAAEPAAGAPRFSLTRAQLLINQRIAQAAIRRLNAVQERLDGGLSAGDLCGFAIGAEDLDPAIATAVAPAALAPRQAAAPEPVRSAPRRARSATGTVRLTAAQLLINQRIGQAAVRRANGLAARLAEGLTGGDIRDGQLSQAKLAERLRVVAAPATPAPAPSRTVVPPRQAPANPGAVGLTPAQLRINQRVYQAAVRRANALVARLEAGITGAEIRDGSLTAADLAGEVAGGGS